MGYDNTPSRDRTIFIVGVCTVITLIFALPLLRSYFFAVLEPMSAERAAGAGHAQLDRYHADQARALGGIDNAIATLGQRGRVASPAIAPRAEGADQTGPVLGWAQIPNEHAAAEAQAAYELGERMRAEQAAALAAAAGADGGVPALDATVTVTTPTPTPAPAPTRAPAPTPAPGVTP